MRFLVDRCAGRRLAVWLQSNGHDVLDLAAMTPDPGDAQLLALAHAQQRVLVTIDTDFGKLIYREGAAHAGVVRLPDVPAAVRIQIMSGLLERHAAELAAGAIITVRGTRVRISPRRPTKP